MPPKINVKIDSNAKKLATGLAVKNEVKKAYKPANLYQRLNYARYVLNLDSSKFKTSGERDAITKEIDKCLELLDEFYTGKDKENLVMMDKNQFDNASAKIQTVFTTINDNLVKAVAAYDNYLKTKDPEYAKTGKYLGSAPNEKYIYRHIAVDELNEIANICKVASNDKSIKYIGDNLSRRMMQTVSVDDIFLGREKAIQQAANLRTKGNGISDKLPELIGILKRYSEIGNQAALVMYERIKDIDLTPYYTLKDGKYPTLTQDDIRKLTDITTTIKDVTRGFFDKIVGNDDESLNFNLAPETVGPDGRFDKNAIAYRKNLESIVKSLDEVSNEMKVQVEKASRHPEVYTLPAVFKAAARDEFLGDISIEKAVVELAKTTTVEAAKNDKKKVNAMESGQAVQAIRQAAIALTDFINGQYEIGPDGFYKSTPAANIKVMQTMITNLENVIKANEGKIKENISSLAEKDAEKYLGIIKKTLETYKAAADKAINDCNKSKEGTFDHENTIIAGYIDPNAEVRKTLADAREQRVANAYEEQDRQILEKANDPHLDSFGALDVRYMLLTSNRYFAKPENMDSMAKMMEAYSDVVNKLRIIYAKDGHGGFTHFADENEKLALRDAMIKARDEISKALKKSGIPESVKTNLTAVNEMLGNHVNVLNQVWISGKYSVAELLDAGKFGYPSIERAIRNAKGLDRYDWNNTNQINDQQQVSYEDYINPFDKIKEDLEKFRIAGENPKNNYTDKEKQWIETIKNYMDTNFGKAYIDEFYKPKTVHDQNLGVDVNHTKIMTKAEQDELRNKFKGLHNLIEGIGGDEEFSKSENKTISALMHGIATFARVTSHRLDTFHWDLDVPVYTIQEAISGQADTHDYNFRNEITRFTRLHQDQTLAGKLEKAGILMKDEDKWEEKVDEQGNKTRVRKMEKEPFSLLTQVATLFQYERKQYPVFDYNDLTYLLDKIKTFEEEYFRCTEDGDYVDIPRTFEEIGEEGFEGKIRTYEQMKWVYSQIQFHAALMKDKAVKYNEKNKDNPIPQAYIDGLEVVFQKGLRVQTLLAQVDAQRTRPDMVNVIELMHSDPKKRENMWTIRQNKIFHRHRQQQGQIKGYRKLEHFQYKWGSEMTYNGRFFDSAETYEKGEKLNAYLDGLVAKYGATLTEEEKAFAKALIEAVKNDPDAASKSMPTADDFKNNADKYNDGSILADVTKDLGLGDHRWWENNKEKEFIRNIVSDMSSIGISRVDYAEREKCGAKYGENLVNHFIVMSKISEALTKDKPNGYPYERLIPRAYTTELTVPGEPDANNKYKGVMVEATPDVLGYQKEWDEEKKKYNLKGVRTISGKDILKSTDQRLVSIDCFNNGEFLEGLANLQAICFLCNAPMPKFEDLKIAMQNDKNGKMKAHLMSYMPEPAFLEGDFEGKLKLEDIGVVPQKLGDVIKNLTAGLKKNEQEDALRDFADRMTKNIPGMTDDAKKRMEEIIIKNAKDMSKYLNDPDLTKEGKLTTGTGRKKKYHNGIRSKKILLTTDFDHLTVDKLSLKPSLFEDNKEGRENIFTQIAKVPEQIYANIDEKVNGDEFKNKAFVARFVNGIMRQVQSMNLEATLADIDDKTDEYKIHKWFQKDSENFQNMHEILHRLRKFEETGELEYEDDNGNTKKIGFTNLDLYPNGTIDDHTLEILSGYFQEARRYVSKYIDTHKGTLFGPVSDMGQRRLEAAREINVKVNNIFSVIEDLKSRERKVDPIVEEPEVNVELEKKFGDIPTFPKESENPEAKNGMKERINANELKEEDDDLEDEKEDKKAKKDKDKKKSKKAEKEDEKDDEKDNKKSKDKGKGNGKK
jgi:hypothetical protein